MKKFFFLVIFSILLFTIPKAHADCNIRPSAVTDLNDLYGYTHADLSRPRLKIDNGKLRAADDVAAQPYSLGTLKKKYYFGGYTQGSKITIYSKIFKLHKKCDKQVKSKLRGMLAHEYTHYLDSYGVLSNLIHSSNDEETAIVSEHVLSELVWGNVSVQYTRPLTASEQIQAAILRNFFIKNKQ
jgi:hypothetical protein